MPAWSESCSQDIPPEIAQLLLQKAGIKQEWTPDLGIDLTFYGDRKPETQHANGFS
jgi:hypothetical protein